MPQSIEHQPDEDPAAQSTLHGGAPNSGQNTDPMDPENEATLWEGRPSWKDFGDILVLASGGTLLGAVIAIMLNERMIGWVCFFGVLGLWLYAGLRMALGMLNYHYKLTSQRLFVSQGVFSKTIDQAELFRVDDVRVHKSFFDRILGIGTVELLTQDETNKEKPIRIQGVPEPETLADRIRKSVRLLHRGSVRVERL